MLLKNFNYTGKRVFVGMDVHKNKYVISAICEGVVAKKWSTQADPVGVAEQLTKFFPQAHIFSAYEAGFSGFTLHRVLSKAGINSRVINAASVEIESNNRVKTDKKDAKKLAEQLAVGRLKGIYVPTEKEEARRALSRGREQVVERRTRIGNQLKMKLYYLGINMPGDMKISESFMKWIENLELAAENKFVLDELVDAWRQETKRIKRFNEQLKKQADQDELEEIYRSAPGVGPVTSRVLSNELGDMTRFDNQKQLFSSTGLTPSEHSSGDKIRKGNISRQGSGRIRGLLIEAAWRAISEDKSLQEFYQRIAFRRDSKRAIVAVARKLVGRLRHCLKEKEKWVDQSVQLKAA